MNFGWCWVLLNLIDQFLSNFWILLHHYFKNLHLHQLLHQWMIILHSCKRWKHFWCVITNYWLLLSQSWLCHINILCFDILALLLLKRWLDSNLVAWLHYNLTLSDHRLILDLGLLESGVCLLKLRMLSQMLVSKRVIEIFVAFTDCKQYFATFISKLSAL